MCHTSMLSHALTQNFAVFQVWDVISNQEAVEIISSTADRAKASKRLVEKAVCAWKRKRRGIATDDISAVCLFLNSSSSPPKTESV